MTEVGVNHFVEKEQFVFQKNKCKEVSIGFCTKEARMKGNFDIKANPLLDLSALRNLPVFVPT